MSSLSFESRNGTVEVSGSELFQAHHLTTQVTLDALSVSANKYVLYEVLNEKELIQDPAMLAVHLGVFIASDGATFNMAGETVTSEYLKYNTAMETGDDGMRFMTRIAAQSEMQTYVEGPNRAWLADIIENASEELVRPGNGWDKVIALLRSRDDEPVVTSYSVSGAFFDKGSSDWRYNWLQENYPNLDTLESYEYGSAEDESWNTFYELPSDEKWSICIDWLRNISANETLGREMKPETWVDYRFGFNTTTASELLEFAKNKV